MNTSPLMALALTGGDWVIWGLLVASVIGVAIGYSRIKLLRAERLALNALRKPFLATLDEKDFKAAGKVLDTHPCSAARALVEVLDREEVGFNGGPQHLTAALSDERRHLEGRLLWLGTLGNNAPFVGLFGTTLGVIRAFHDLAQSGAGPEVVMSGLSEALVATAVGLLVAIPCVLAFNVLQKVVRDILSETEALGMRLIAASGAHGAGRK